MAISRDRFEDIISSVYDGIDFDGYSAQHITETIVMNSLDNAKFELGYSQFQQIEYKDIVDGYNDDYRDSIEKSILVDVQEEMEAGSDE